LEDLEVPTQCSHFPLVMLISEILIFGLKSEFSHSHEC